ncbi:MAG: hypothetical protein GF329_04645 [Candidatus Lokiarchaeota archaeon]|nr:hypothetical protein [Candidatus Lokiarchaeota archaeon]
MQKKIVFLAFFALLVALLLPSSRAIIIMSESYEFNGIRGYTVHAVSSGPVRHQVNSVNNASVTIYVLNRALNMSEVYSEPTDYVYSFSGTDINEVFTISAAAVSIIIYTENPVEGSITWDHSIGFPDQGMNILMAAIIITVVGVGLFIVYRVYRWRKLQE